MPTVKVDTTKFRTTERDRLTGDTIVAYFDSIPARDTTSKPRIRLLVATGHATSLQHLPPRDTSVCIPAINYVRGQGITVRFDSSKVSTVHVRDPEQSSGVYIEPNPDSTARCHVVAATPTPPGGAPAAVPGRSPAPRVPAPQPTPAPGRPVPAPVPAPRRP
mgnify:CR=1 FL=1